MFRSPRQYAPDHLAWVRTLPCCVCPTHHDIETEAAHVRFSCADAGKLNPGVGAKPHDKWTLPLCGEHHRMQHAWGEKAFWKTAARDPIKIAQELWANTGKHELGVRIAREAGR